MTIRPHWPFRGKRYLGNTNKKEVHDLLKEKPFCEIDSIRPQHIKMFDSLESAKKENFDNCAYCLGGSQH